MEQQEIKLPNIEKIKQETIESATAFKEKKEQAVSEEILKLKEHITKISIPADLHIAASRHNAELQNLSDTDKISRLVEIAFEKGPLTAIVTAQKMNDAHILDALHDTLSKDELFNKLTAIGKI